MNILLLGSGGREHALAWKMKQSEKCDRLFIAPGNAGTALVGNNVLLNINDFESIAAFCLKENIELLVVGPEDPLVHGIQDYFKSQEAYKNIAVIGPSAEASKLEGSKAYAKDFMARHNIPTAAYKEFTKENFDEGLAYIDKQKTPIVLKADGLAAGKGVIISESREEAKTAYREMIQDEKFGTASSKVVIEDFLDGIEMSVFALTDGENYVLLPDAKDYKRIGEGDKGLNTGGMGAISPVPFANETFMQKVEEQVVKPTIEGIKKDGLDYKGFVFFGLIKVNDEPFVIEYNCRLGDPETEVILPRLESDLVHLFIKTANKELKDCTVAIKKDSCSTVILVSGGYPEGYVKGKVINGLEAHKNQLIFHAGTKQDGDKIITNGGRVLALSAYGSTLNEALNISNKLAQSIDFEGKKYRTDIGYEFKD